MKRNILCTDCISMELDTPAMPTERFLRYRTTTKIINRINSTPITTPMAAPMAGELEFEDFEC